MRSSICGAQQKARDITEQRERCSKYPFVEPTLDMYDSYVPDVSWGTSFGIFSRTLRVKITGRDGVEKVNIKIPVSIPYFNLY